MPFDTEGEGLELGAELGGGDMGYAAVSRERSLSEENPGLYEL